MGNLASKQGRYEQELAGINDRIQHLEQLLEERKLSFASWQNRMFWIMVWWHVAVVASASLYWKYGYNIKWFLLPVNWILELVSIRVSDPVEWILNLFLVPIVRHYVVLLARRYCEQRLGSSETKLRQLRARQKSKLEELKQKTNFYKTRDLINKYETTRSEKKIVAPGLSAKDSPGPAPQPSSWMDKLADAVLGDDSISKNPADSTFALICAKCQLHNGLVSRKDYLSLKYFCPRCNHWNDQSLGSPLTKSA